MSLKSDAIQKLLWEKVWFRLKGIQLLPSTMSWHETLEKSIWWHCLASVHAAVITFHKTLGPPFCNSNLCKFPISPLSLPSLYSNLRSPFSAPKQTLTSISLSPSPPPFSKWQKVASWWSSSQFWRSSTHSTNKTAAAEEAAGLAWAPQWPPRTIPPPTTRVIFTPFTWESPGDDTSSAQTSSTTHSSRSSPNAPATRQTPSTCPARSSCSSTCFGCSKMPIPSRSL